MRKKIRYYLDFILVRPYRRFFLACVARGSFEVRWLPEKDEYAGFMVDVGETLSWWNKYQWPNPHWVFLYKTVFKFFNWLDWDAWRHLCKWEGPRGMWSSCPWYAWLVHGIGETTAGGSISCHECWHCASKEGCQIELSNDETGEFFKDVKNFTSSSEDGTDYRFRGTTICPKCGFESEFEDGSL